MLKEKVSASELAISLLNYESDYIKEIEIDDEIVVDIVNDETDLCEVDYMLRLDIIERLIWLIANEGDFQVSRVVYDDEDINNIAIYELNESEENEMLDLQEYGIEIELEMYIKEKADDYFDVDLEDELVVRVFDIIEDDYNKYIEEDGLELDELLDMEEFEDLVCDAISSVLNDDEDDFEINYNKIVNDYENGIDYDEINEDDYDFEDVFENACLVGNIDDIDNLLEKEYEKNLGW